MATQSIRFDFLSTGAARLAADFRSTGDSASSAARGAKILQTVIADLGQKENRTAAESANLAKALRLTGDAEDRAAAKALAADIAIRRLDDAMKDSSKNTGSARSGFLGLAGTVTGFGDAADAATSGGNKFKLALAGLNLASGVLEPAMAGIVVAAGGLAAGFAAAGAGIGVFGAVAKTVFTEASKGATAYAAAQAKYASATTSAQRVAALQAEKAAFAGMSPPVKALAVELGNTQKMWKAFTDAAAPGVVGVISQGLGLLPKILASMKPFLAPVEAALRGIIGQLNTGLSSSGFKSFIDVMAKNTGPAITKIAAAIGNVIVGIGGILKAFLPASQQMLTGLDKITAKFREWGTTLSGGTGFQSLMTTFRTETPQALKILTNLGAVITNVGKAMFGLSSFSNSRLLLSALLPLSGVMASLSKNTDLVRVAMYALLAVKIGQQFSWVTDAWKGIVKFAAVTQGATVAETIAAAATRAWGLAMAALPWVALAAAVVAVALLIIKYHQQIWAFVQKVWHDILAVIMGTWNWVKSNWPLLVGIITGPIGLAVVFIIRHWTTMTTGIAALFGIAKNQIGIVWDNIELIFLRGVQYILNIMGKLPGPLGAPFRAAAKDIGGSMAGIEADVRRRAGQIQAAIDKIHGKSIVIHMNGQGLYTITGGAVARSQGPGGSGNAAGGLAAGGLIRMGSGPTSDDVHALVSRGEYVHKATAVSKYGVRAMDAVNQGRAVIGYAGGGVVRGDLTPGFISGMYSDFQGQMTGAMVAAMRAAIKAAIAAAKTAAAVGGGMVSYKAGAGVAQWAGVILRALGMLGQSPGWLGTVERRMNQESGGNPNIVNKWDSNWIAGHPSVGLMQVIRGTYQSYAGPFRGTGPFSYGVSVNPLANTYAGLNYAIHNYGSLSALNRPGGYALGTSSAAPGWAWVGERGRELVHFRGGEQVIPAHAAGGGGDLISEIRALRAEVRQLTGVATGIPAATGRHVGGAINSAAGAASFRSRYPAGGA